MIDPQTRAELFIPLATFPGTEELDVHYEAPFNSAEEFAVKAFKGLEPGEELELVITTHLRNATEECNALLREMREVHAGLFEFRSCYDVGDSLKNNRERLELLRGNDKPSGFY